MLSKATAFALAILAYIMLSYGFVLQKKGIAFIGYKGPRDTLYKKNKLTWFIGLLLINIVNFPLFFSLKILPSYIVNAVSGLNVLFTLLFAWLILREKVKISDLIYAVVLCVSIAFANVADTNTIAPYMSAPLVYFFAFFPLIVFLLVLLSGKIKQISAYQYVKGIISVICGGSMGGFMIITMKVLQMQNGNKLSMYLASPLFYIYFMHGFLSIVAIQYAYKRGGMVVIAPAQYASLVFYPILTSYFIFGLTVIPLQIAAFALILFSIIMIVKSHASTMK